MLAEQVQLGLEAGDILGSGHKNLDRVGFGSPGRLSQNLRVHRHLADMGKFQPGFLGLLADDGQISLPFHLVLRQEHQTGAIFQALRYRNTLQEDKFVGYLQQNTCAVAGLVVGSFRTAVLHIFQHGQGVVDQLVTLVALQADQHSDTAGIVLISGVV